jgi:hypothetical protein
MTSNLLISYPELSDAVSWSCSSLAASNFSVENLRHGSPSAHFKLNTTGLIVDVDVDMGSASHRSFDHLILGRADMLQIGSVTNVGFYLDTASSFNYAQSVYETAAFASATLYGPNTEDFVTTFAATDARRHARVRLVANTGASNFRFSKIFAGTIFDMGIDPDDYEYSIAEAGAAAVQFDSGKIMLTRDRRPRYVFMVRWSLVTDAKALDFCSKILANPNRCVYLYAPDTGNAEILAGNNLVYCRVLADNCMVERSTVDDRNTVTAYFEQIDE